MWFTVSQKGPRASKAMFYYLLRGGGSFGRLFEKFFVPSCDKEKGWENKKKSMQLSKYSAQFQ